MLRCLYYTCISVRLMHPLLPLRICRSPLRTCPLPSLATLSLLDPASHRYTTCRWNANRILRYAASRCYAAIMPTLAGFVLLVASSTVSASMRRILHSYYRSPAYRTDSYKPTPPVLPADPPRPRFDILGVLSVQVASYPSRCLQAASSATLASSLQDSIAVLPVSPLAPLHNHTSPPLPPLLTHTRFAAAAARHRTHSDP
ncbi:hypothetical protein Syun_030800 [Stephania yunnanensis]|uniref:Uncharacterized protein n=1 Tax=Stephania yunnanensis TaxID=152371 RepID=A0AAP0DUT3_9MAGN